MPHTEDNGNGETRSRLERVEDAVSSLQSSVESLAAQFERIGDKLSTVSNQSSNTAGKVTAIFALLGSVIALVLGGVAYTRAQQAQTVAQANCNSAEGTKATMRSILLLFQSKVPVKDPVADVFTTVLPLTQQKDCS